MNLSTRLRWALFWIFALVVFAVLFAEHRAGAWGLGVHALLLAICLGLLYGVLRLDGRRRTGRED
ncbi:MAG: hypothetical protein KIT17_25335 [Rubrivivax sp.]|nr:hypothetical protein [Rubrivivax sp.]